jgi:hypothetical protein
MGHENLALLTGGAGIFESDGDQASVGAYAPPSGVGQSATPYGTIVEVFSAGAGQLYSNGTWAATSP